MKIPTSFNPQTIPSRRLSEFYSTASLPLLTRSALQRALDLDSPELLRRDFMDFDKVRHAAVLVLLIEQADDFDVVLTVRSSDLRHHGGQVSFVGGAMDAGETAVQAAVREAQEEIGLSPVGLEIIGALPIYHTITGFAVTPIVACMSATDWQEQSLKLDAREVAQVFTVPLSVLLNHDLIDVHQYEQRHFYSVTHNGYFIWGASMAIVRNLDILLRLG